MYYNNTVGTLKIHLCPSHIGHALRLPGAVSQGMLHDTSLRNTLAAPEVATLFLLDPSSITKMQL